MHPSELRIGNLVFYRRNQSLQVISTVEGILRDSVFIKEDNQDGSSSPKSLNLISPIPLTEDWLLKFGLSYNWVDEVFEDEPSEKDYLILTRASLNDVTIDRDFNVCVRDEYGISKIAYVHQLQNWYYIIVGKDLEYFG